MIGWLAYAPALAIAAVGGVLLRVFGVGEPGPGLVLLVAVLAAAIALNRALGRDGKTTKKGKQ